MHASSFPRIRSSSLIVVRCFTIPIARLRACGPSSLSSLFAVPPEPSPRLFSNRPPWTPRILFDPDCRLPLGRLLFPVRFYTSACTSFAISNSKSRAVCSSWSTCRAAGFLSRPSTYWSPVFSASPSSIQTGGRRLHSWRKGHKRLRRFLNTHIRPPLCLQQVLCKTICLALHVRDRERCSPAFDEQRLLGVDAMEAGGDGGGGGGRGTRRGLKLARGIKRKVT
ncbi:hypothetical protein C8R46DRAFT_1216751 [Mycena filopes]|nr:hypothetical protein C8R46DRAFT_1216751 [Mycena filopes]